MCEALFYLKQLKFTCLDYFLAYLGSSVKTTISEISDSLSCIRDSTGKFFLVSRLYKSGFPYRLIRSPFQDIPKHQPYSHLVAFHNRPVATPQSNSIFTSTRTKELEMAKYFQSSVAVATQIAVSTCCGDVASTK